MLAQEGDQAHSTVQPLMGSFRERFFECAKTSREERMGNKAAFNRDKRGQSLSHR